MLNFVKAFVACLLALSFGALGQTSRVYGLPGGYPISVTGTTSVTGTVNILGGLPTSTNIIGTVVNSTGTNIIGSLSTSTNSIGSVVNATGTNLIGGLATSTNSIGTVTVPTSSNLIGGLATSTNNIGRVTVGTSTNSIGVVTLPVTASTTPTLVGDGSSSSLYVNRYGGLHTDNTAAVLFNSGGTCSSVTTTTQCLGLSGAGLSYYISTVFLNAVSGQTFSVISSTTAGNACATSPSTIWPTTWIPAGGGGPIPLADPIKVTANSAICCVVSGAVVASSCSFIGRIAP